MEDFAFVVGLNDYPALGPLRGAQADARDFFAWVTDPQGGGIDPDQTRPDRPADLILSSLDAAGGLPKPARSEVDDVLRKYDRIANQRAQTGGPLKTGRRLYVFFSGHGFAPTSADS